MFDRIYILLGKYFRGFFIQKLDFFLFLEIHLRKNII